MKAFAHSIILAIALASPAHAWGERPSIEDTPVNRISETLAAQRFLSMNCEGMGTDRWKTDQFAARYGVSQAEQARPEFERRVRAWQMFFIKNKDQACAWIWNAFGPNGRRTPGIVYADPRKHVVPLPF